MTAGYPAWNGALAEHLLQGRAGELLHLYVDRGVLNEVGERLGMPPGSGRDDFLASLRTVVSGARPFERWRRTALEWRRDGFDGQPPFLAVLALLVLAAAERSSRHFQYYPELNGLLGRPGETKQPEAFDEDVPYMFRVFNEWLDGPGSVHGIATAIPYKQWSYIGWPLSQALVRPTDRTYVLDSFAALGLRPKTPLDGAFLRNRLVQRLRVSGDSPSRARLEELDAHFREFFELYLYREFKAWDGSRPGSSVQAVRLTLRLAFAEDDGAWWFCLPRPAGLEGRTVQIGGSTLHVPHRGALLHLEVPEVMRLLGRGEVGRIEDGPALVSPARPARYLSLDKDAAGWCERNQRFSDERQLCLLPAHSPAADEAASHGAARRDDAPEGWLLLDLPPGLILGEPPDRAADNQAVLQLTGGLVLRRSTSTYLREGPPDVEGADAVRVEAAPVPVRAGRARLADLSLLAGPHVVEADSTQFTIRLQDQLLEDLQAVPCPGWPQSGDAVGMLMETAGPAVRGARVPIDGAGPRRTTIPVTDVYWAVGERGEMAVRPITRPGWLERLGLTALEVDITGGLRNVGFAPSFVVLPAKHAASKARVFAVAAQAPSQDGERELDLEAARALLQGLLTVGYRLADASQERSWKRALAELMRRLHR